MPESEDISLLKQYAEGHSEGAFAVLVGRYVDLVYSTALRQVGNPSHSEEITQAVFIILAQKAKLLSPKTILSGWLYQTARLTAANFVRSEISRQRREQEAYMQSTLIESNAGSWEQLAPLLDEAMGRLGESDRNIIVMRFFENKTAQEVALTLKLNEVTARKRVSRALEKLQRFFTRRGISSTTATISGTISNNSVQAAPAALANSVTVVAIAKGATASSSTLILVKGTLKMLMWTKLKLASGIGTAVLLAGSVVTVALSGIADQDTASGDDRYQIDGDILFSSSDHDMARTFTLTVNGANWAVHLTSPQMQSNGIQYQEVVQLNGTVYRYDYYGRPAPGAAKNSGSAVIERGDFPVEDGTFANFVWVGLASASYFSGATNGDVVSLSNHPRDARTHKDSAAWQLSERPPHLPVSIDYFQKPIQGILLRPGVTLHQFDNGWKSGEVRVVSETNVGNKTFPMVYTYEQFRPKVNAVSSNDVERQCLVTVNVRKIKITSVSDVLPPKTEGTTAVGETRFPGNTSNKQALYFATASRLPEKTEADGIKAYNQQIAPHSITGTHRLAEPNPPSRHKWIWFAIILAVSAIAVLAGVAKRRREN